MGSMKGAVALIAVLVPVAYCGAMLFYFVSVGGGSVEGATAMGLGPTVLGLGAFGLLFMIPLVVRLVRLGAKPAASGSRRSVEPPEEEAFDADAALARYLARKAEAGEEIPVALVAEPGGAEAPATRPTFGRKTV